jgi:hypothetical protein
MDLPNFVINNKCEVCLQQRAIGYNYGKWICGFCMCKINDKQKEVQKRMIDDLILENTKCQ